MGSNGPISILWDPGSRFVVRCGKSVPPGDSRIQKTHQVRTIALDPVARAILTARQARAESEAATACVPLSSDAFVWSTQADGLSPRTPNSLTRAFHRLCRTMETEALASEPPRVESWKFRFHDLRHLSATEMVGQGMDPRTVAARLGHANPSVTLAVYAHAAEARDREAADGLGRSRSVGHGDVQKSWRHMVVI